MLGARVVEGQHVDDVARLIERVELLAETEEVFLRAGGPGNRRLQRLERSPVDDLVTQHAFVSEAELCLDLGFADCLPDEQPIGHGRRRNHGAEQHRPVRRENRRRAQIYDVRRRRARQIRPGQLDVTGRSAISGPGADRRPPSAPGQPPEAPTVPRRESLHACPLFCITVL